MTYLDISKMFEFFLSVLDFVIWFVAGSACVISVFYFKKIVLIFLISRDLFLVAERRFCF